jgi:hypothetical protein
MMNVIEPAFTMLRDFSRTLLAQIWAGVLVPLDVETSDFPAAPGKTRHLDLCDEMPGHLCRNGYGSLEVGGIRDRAEG